MSNLEEAGSTPVRCAGEAAPDVRIEAYPGRESELGGGLVIRRALPHARQRLVGPWCFLDHFGPLGLAGTRGLRVAPHPHIGLQTVTWVLEGEILHRDSLGFEQLIRPGQLNIMTAGRGIAHSEETPSEHGPRLHGVQLWVALPSADRDVEPAFDHHAALPQASVGGLDVTIVAGDALGEHSPARTFSPLVGMDVTVAPQAASSLPLDPAYEHAALVVEGAVRSGETTMTPGSLYYLGTGRDGLALSAREPARLMVIGGEPLGEEIVLWWNFVAGDHETLRAAREDWQQGRRFGEVRGYDGEPLAAPALRVRA